MQQGQSQVQRPKPRRSISRTAKIWMGFLITILLIAVWIANIIGWIPTIWGINPTQQASILTAVAAVLAAFFAFVPIIPPDKVDAPEPVAQTPPQPIPVPPPMTFYISPSPTPADTTQHAAPAAKSIDYTHMQTELPATNKKVIQQREGVVKEVYAQLIGEGVSSVALVGIGGIGKSTLAGLVRDYAESQRKEGKGPFTAEASVLTIDGTTTFLDLASNIFALLNKPLLDFSRYSIQSQATALFHVLNTADKPCLIVLDQFENFLDEQTGHALPASAGVGEFIDVLNNQSCTCRILLTSRPVPQGTQADLEACMHIYRVSGLTVEEGIALLRSQQMEGSEAELRQAVQRCDGHGFALTLLVVMIKRDNLSLATLLHDPAYTRLWEKDIAGRPKFLDYIFAHLLDEISRPLLLAFSIYREPVSLEAVLSIVNKPKEELLVKMRSLLIQNLFHVAVKENFELHPLVASYTQNHFIENDQAANQQALQAAHAKAAQYYIQLATKQCPEQSKRRSVKDVQLLIEAVWQHCQAEQWQEAYGLMKEEKLFSSLSRWGANTLLLELCQLLLSENWQYEPLQMALIYGYTASVYNVLGEKQEALKYYEMALRLRRGLRDRKGEGTVLNNIGGVYGVLGDKSKALEYYEQALGIRREVRDRRGEGNTLNNIGIVYDLLDDHSKAAQYFEQALSISQETGDKDGEGSAFNNLGLIYNTLGDKSKARYYFEQALSISQETGDKDGESATLDNLGAVYNTLGDKSKARYYFEQALSIRREMGDRGGEGTTLWNIGVNYLRESNSNVALACFLLAKHIFQNVQSLHAARVEKGITGLRANIGEQQFATLLAQVEPRAAEIVEEAMREVRDGMFRRGGSGG